MLPNAGLTGIVIKIITQNELIVLQSESRPKFSPLKLKKDAFILINISIKS